MSAHVFCREHSIEHGEPLPGTGNMAQRTILVRWPRGKWRVPRFESVDMGPELSEAIRLAMKAGIHVALVDRVGDADAIPQLQAEGIAADFETEAALASAISRYTAGEPLTGRSEPRKIVLCCTDSRRDACCARFGFATYKALVAAADPAEFQILQATHVGGCRFAASLVILPDRRRYGRVAPEEASRFLETIGQGDIYLTAYRGRAGLPQAAQVAEHAAMVWAQQHGFTPRVDLGDTDWPDEVAGGEELTATVLADTHPVSVHLRAEIMPVYGRCEGIGEKSPDPTPRWRLVDVTPLDA